MIIYKCENISNGKCYIGKSVNPLNERISQHFSDSVKRRKNNRFLNSLNKNGRKNFKWKILWEGECSKEWLNKLEKYYIYFYNSCYIIGGFGYNGTLGGEGISSETATRINTGMKKPWTSKMNKKRVGKNNPNYGKKNFNGILERNIKNPPMRNPDIVAKVVAKTRKCVLIVNIKTGEEIIKHGYTKWCDENNINKGNFSGVLNGRLKQTKGFWGRFIK